MTIFEWIKDYIAPQSVAPPSGIGNANAHSAQELCSQLSDAASAPDGLIDYAADYSDGACAAGAQTASAYRVGIGFIDDDEQARWLNLGAGGDRKE